MFENLGMQYRMKKLGISYSKEKKPQAVEKKTDRVVPFLHRIDMIASIRLVIIRRVQ